MEIQDRLAVHNWTRRALRDEYTVAVLCMP